jgi:hypothetical protein
MLRLVAGNEGTCFFNAEDSPCTNPWCLEDPSGEACMQLTAEYCAEHPLDAACELLTPMFTRVLGETSSFTTHVRNQPRGALDTRVEFVPAACECNSIDSFSVCGEPGAEVDVQASFYDRATGRLEVDFTPLAVGSFKLCLVQTPFYTWVADVHSVLPEVTCQFSAEAKTTPCENPACLEDPTGEECMVYMAEYCATSYDDDLVCSMVTILFERPIGVESTISMHLPNVFPTAGVIAVPSRCSCAFPCDVNELLTDVSYESGGKMSITVKPMRLDQYQLCVAPYDGANYSVTAGELRVTANQACVFALAGSPCIEPACLTDPSSDECVQITAAYCASTNDASCSLLELAFVRQVGRGRLSLLVADDVIVQADVNVSVVPTACPCRGPLEGLDAGSGCPANVTAANVFAAASDPHSGVVTVDADFILVGESRLCVNGKEVAIVDILAVPEEYDALTSVPCAESALQGKPKRRAMPGSSG